MGVLSQEGIDRAEASNVRGFMDLCRHGIPLKGPLIIQTTIETRAIVNALAKAGY
jgi:hypothetical protein